MDESGGPSLDPRELQEVVAAVAADNPGAPAVACGDVRLTYGDLLAQADAIATRLAARATAPGEPVAVGLGRTAGHITAILGILRARGAWMPVDVALPRERLQFMLADAGVRSLVSESRLAHLWDGPARDAALWVDSLDVTGPAGHPGAAAARDAGRTAYVIFTSGSTGPATARGGGRRD